MIGPRFKERTNMDENLREEAGCLYYRDKLALNFCLKKAHRVQVLDRNATPCGMLYRLELKLSGVQWAKEYCTALGEIENGGFFKAHQELSVFHRDSRLIRKKFAELVLETAIDEREVLVEKCGWLRWQGELFYVGCDGTIGSRTFMKSVKSLSPKGLPFAQYMAADEKTAIEEINHLRTFSMEDRIMHLIVLESLLDNLLEDRDGYCKMGAVVLGARHSCKSSLTKKWCLAPGRACENASDATLHQLLPRVKDIEDWPIVMDDVSPESSEKERAQKLQTGFVQAYFDGKAVGEGVMSVRGKPVFTEEKLLGREAVREKMLIIRMEKYPKYSGVWTHLDRLKKANETIYQGYLSFIRWICKKADAGEFSREADVCWEEARGALREFVKGESGNRIWLQVETLHAVEILWQHFCNEHGVTSKEGYEERKNWLNFLRQQYHASVLLTESRENVFRHLLFEFLQKRKRDVWIVPEGSSVGELQQIAIDMASEQIGVFIPDMEGLLTGRTHGGKTYPTLLLRVDCLERGINEQFQSEKPFRQMEIKKLMRDSGMAYVRIRSGKDGQNYTFSWLGRSTVGEEEKLLQSGSTYGSDGLSDLIEKVRVKRKYGLGQEIEMFYADFESVVAINLASEVGKMIPWETLKNRDEKRDIWRIFSYANEELERKLTVTLKEMLAVARRLG